MSIYSIRMCLIIILGIVFLLVAYKEKDMLNFLCDRYEIDDVIDIT